MPEHSRPLVLSRPTDSIGFAEGQISLGRVALYMAVYPMPVVRGANMHPTAFRGSVSGAGGNLFVGFVCCLLLGENWLRTALVNPAPIDVRLKGIALVWRNRHNEQTCSLANIETVFTTHRRVQISSCVGRAVPTSEPRVCIRALRCQRTR